MSALVVAGTHEAHFARLEERAQRGVRGDGAVEAAQSERVVA